MPRTAGDRDPRFRDVISTLQMRPNASKHKGASGFVCGLESRESAPRLHARMPQPELVTQQFRYERALCRRRSFPATASSTKFGTSVRAHAPFHASLVYAGNGHDSRPVDFYKTSLSRRSRTQPCTGSRAGSPATSTPLKIWKAANVVASVGCPRFHVFRLAVRYSQAAGGASLAPQPRREIARCARGNSGPTPPGGAVPIGRMRGD